MPQEVASQDGVNINNSSAVVLLSGGLDSTTVLAIAASENENVYTLSFNYGQKNVSELSKAKENSKALNAKRHIELNLPINQIGHSALLKGEDSPKVPTDRSIEEISDGIPETYVPARNTIFLSLGASYAESIGAKKLYIGVNAVDYSGYPDCRPEFIQAFQRTIELGTVNKNKVSIETPLIGFSKSEIIKKGLELGVNYGMTLSCYQNSACGICDSCKLRAQGFAELGLTDPAAALAKDT